MRKLCESLHCVMNNTSLRVPSHDALNGLGKEMGRL